MLTWGSPLRSPAAAGRPSQEAAQPAWPPSPVAFLLCQEDGRVPDARRHARAPPPPPAGHLLLPRTPSMPRTKPRSCPAPLSLSLALLLSPCSLSLSPEALPPPQLVTAALPAVPSPLRRAPELRRDPLYLLVEPRKPECPEEPPSPSSSSSGSAVRRRRFAVTRSPSTPLCCSA